MTVIYHKGEQKVNRYPGRGVGFGFSGGEIDTAFSSPISACVFIVAHDEVIFGKSWTKKRFPVRALSVSLLTVGV